MNNQHVIMREQSPQRARVLDALRSMIQRIEAGENSENALAEALRGIYADAALEGYDVAALRRIVRLRKWLAIEFEKGARREFAALRSSVRALEARA